ncbi:MAG: GNAT family N-acetyltransferase [Oscillospiraceae bacterium]|nr:GNAT family N-acetyltransferase [Oscillospiraceae bacterium]
MQSLTPKFIKYGSIAVACGTDKDLPALLSAAPADFLQATIPFTNTAAAQLLCQNGFYFADRFVTATINVKRSTYALARSRFALTCGTAQPQQMLPLAKEAFVTDRRFHLQRHYNPQLAGIILQSYLETAYTQNWPVFYCTYKEELAGFLVLQTDENGAYVYLAAAAPKYQGSGAAIELYAAALDYCRTQGIGRMWGRISTANTAVANLYAMLGASFGLPEDVYLCQTAPQQF